MKRIKVLLTAVGVLTAVGSALAYSGSFNQTICYVTRPTGGCTAQTNCSTLDATAQVDDTGAAHCYRIVPTGTTSCSNFKCPTPGTVSNN